MVEMDIETLKMLLNTLLNNPLNLLAIVGLSYIIKEVRSISNLKDRVTESENNIKLLNKEVEELKRKLERLDNEHREYTRRGGKH